MLFWKQKMSESRLIRVLMEKGFLDEKGLERARQWQKKLGSEMSLPSVLVRLGIVREADLTKALAEVEAVRALERITDDMLDYEAMMMLDDEFLTRHNVVLIRGDMGRTEVAHWEEVPFEVMEQIQFLTNRVLEPVVAPRREVVNALRRYLSLGELQRREKALEVRKKSQASAPPPRPAAAQQQTEKEPLLLKLVRLLLEKGILSEDEIAASLGRSLREKGVLSDDDLRSLTGEQPS